MTDQSEIAASISDVLCNLNKAKEIQKEIEKDLEEIHKAIEKLLEDL